MNRTWWMPKLDSTEWIMCLLITLILTSLVMLAISETSEKRKCQSYGGVYLDGNCIDVKTIDIDR